MSELKAKGCSGYNSCSDCVLDLSMGETQSNCLEVGYLLTLVFTPPSQQPIIKPYCRLTINVLYFKRQ